MQQLMHKISANKGVQFGIIVAIFLILYHTISEDGGLFWRLPALLAWLPVSLNDWVEYLLFDFWPVQVYDAEFDEYIDSNLIKEFTRSISSSLLFLIQFIREIILGGVNTIVSFTSWDYVDETGIEWPALPWTIIAALAFILGYSLKGIGLSLLAGLTTAYIAVFGQWQPAMQTLSFILIAVPISFILGLTLGVLAYKNKTFETILAPILNIAQTMPHFSFLVPVFVLFGVGDHAGAIATIIFATPPMIRLTLLGLKKVAPEVLEAAKMSGCKNYQVLFKVLIPSARYDILIGVNQVIMQCLAMAVIASYVGAKGLGFNLLGALNQLRVGQALELGVSIVLIAIVLDKLSLAWANKQVDYFADLPFIKRNKFSLLFLVVSIVCLILAYFGTFIFDEINYFYLIPHNKGLTTEAFWQSGVDYIVENWYSTLKVFNVFVITNILIPVKQMFLAMPVVATFFLMMSVAYLAGGIKSMIAVFGFLLFIAFTPWWDRALITAYLATIAVIVSSIIGMVVGGLCAQNKTASKFILIVCDTFQTFPSFIYLIPVIMLFGVTDTSVIIAVIVYATIPATRYTVEGLKRYHWHFRILC